MNSLVTGVPGSGKTTLTVELNRRPNVLAYDADETIGRWEDQNWQPISQPEAIDAATLPRLYFNWKKASLLRLLTDTPDIFVCGASRNQDQFYRHFDNIFLLQIDEQTLEKRLTARLYGLGHTEVERRLVSGWHQDFEQRAIQNGAMVLDGTLPPSDIADEIIAHVRPAKSKINLKLPEISLPEIALAPEPVIGEAS